MLPGIIPVFNTFKATVALTDHAVDTATATAHTFTNKAIGAAAGNRYVVVCVGAYSTASNPISSVTIGGVTANSQVTQNVAHGNGNYGQTGIFSLLVASGTTATIVVNMTGNSLGCGIAVYAVNANSGTATATNSAHTTTSTSSISASLAINNNGVGVGYGFEFWDGGAFATPTDTWTNLTKDVDEAVVANQSQHTSASSSVSGTSTRTLNISASTTPTDVGLVLAAFA